jgi:ribonuclease HI
VLKINVDAALSKNTSIAAMAAVARDDSGRFQGASVIVMEGVTDPETAEVLACREGVALADDLAQQ